MRVAIIGSGIAGLTSAYVLNPRHDVTVFERDARAGGHAHTVDVDLSDGRVAVDTGFIVYNEANYPGLSRLFGQLGVTTQPSEMSFSVSNPARGLEWRPGSLRSLLAYQTGVSRREVVATLLDIVRFNRRARALTSGAGPSSIPLGDLVASSPGGERIAEWYLRPMVSAIWSAPLEDALNIPAHTFARFFENHGLLSAGGRPQWRTVAGGSRSYVNAIAGILGDRLRLSHRVEKVVRRREGVEVFSEERGSEHFDHVIFATHSDTTLSLLSDPSDAEHEILGDLRYQMNSVVLHTDRSLLPESRHAWASWNYRVGSGSRGATVTYHMNRLQSLATRDEVCVTLNQDDLISPERVLGRFEYAHPLFDAAAIAAQSRYDEISGRSGTWFCGAYWGYGFHEDGVQSALRVCRGLDAALVNA